MVGSNFGIVQFRVCVVLSCFWANIFVWTGVVVYFADMSHFCNAASCLKAAVCLGHFVFPPLRCLSGTVQLLSLQPSHHCVCWSSSGMCRCSRTAQLCPLDWSVTSSDHSCVKESFLFPGSTHSCVFITCECQVQAYRQRDFFLWVKIHTVTFKKKEVIFR